MKAHAQTFLRAAAAITIGGLAAVALACNVYANSVFAAVGRDLEDPEGCASALISPEDVEFSHPPATGRLTVRVSAI